MIRVFPRKTKATPDDADVRFSEPTLFDEKGHDKVHISVTFTWDKQRGEQLYDSWEKYGHEVSIGGAAYDDPGSEFEPGLYLKHGYTITSRGCPNNCWFCMTPKREGVIRELKIKDGYNILDSNLLACSEQHIREVFEMLKRQKEKPRFTGGLEAARMTDLIAEYLSVLKPKTAYFAYDTPNDYDPLVEACKILARHEIIPDTSHSYSCYVLVGYKNDTFEKAEKRIMDVMRLGITPMAMLYNHGKGLYNQKEWIHFQRLNANRYIVAAKMRVLNKI